MNIFERILNEINYNDFLKKQYDIEKLYPQFAARVKAVAQRGGVKMSEMLPDTWHFKVNSGTQEGVRYDVYIKFKNMTQVLTKWVFNETMWLPTKEHVDYRKIAAEVINDVDLEADCSCPSDLYSGFEYLKTQRDAQYGSQENRPPVRNNPKQRGLYCKHGNLVMTVLPFYVSTFSSFLKKFWKPEIEQLESLYKQEILAGEEESEDVPSTLSSQEPQISTETGQEEEIPVQTTKDTSKQEEPLKTSPKSKINKATKPATTKYRGDYNTNG